MENTVQSLPASWYHDAEVFKREQRDIFAKQWIFVAPVGELLNSGDYATARVAGHSIVVVRKESGEIAGFYNLCRHRASTLCSKKKGNIPLFVCPYHSWTYGLDGKLKGAPGFDLPISNASESTHPDLGLIPVRVASWNGLVFVCLDNKGLSLLEWLGEVVGIAENFPEVEEMEFERMLENDGGVNWKNYSDNSAEGYHLSSVHGKLNRSLVKNATQIRVHEDGQFVGFDVTYRGEGKEADSPGYWIYKYPGLLLHFSQRSFNIERVIPVSETQTRMERWFWFDHSVTPDQRQETIAFSNEIMDEDVGICAQVQQNLEGGVYDTGYLSKDREPGTIFFQKCVRESLGLG